MKKITVSILTTLLMLSMVFSSSVFAAEKEQSAWDSFLGLFSAKTAATSDVGVEYRGHIQNVGNYPLDGSWIQGPTELGTEGKGLRLEGFWIQLDGDVPADAHIEYQVHVQNVGWMDPVQDGEFAGTEGRSLQIEAIKISLVDDEGVQLEDYSVVYSGHVQNVGDVGPFTNGEQLGTVGSFLRLEAIEVEIVQNPADLTEYNAALAAVTQADYTAASWTTYQAVVNANKMTEDNLQSEVDAATANITAAQANLVLVPRVASVTAVNAKTMQITFNTAIKADTVVDNNGTTTDLTDDNLVDGAITVAPLDGNAVTINSAKASLSADGKTLTLIAAGAEFFGGRYDVTVPVGKILTTTLVPVEKYQATITMKDTTAPTIVSTEKTSATTFKVKFSEPIKALGSYTFKLADGTVLTTATTGTPTGVLVTFTAGNDYATFTLGSAVTANKVVTGTFVGTQDYASNLITPNPSTVTFTRGDLDGVAPTVSSLTAVNNKTLVVKFSEELAAAPTITGMNGTLTYTQDATDKTIYTVKSTAATTGLVSITVSAGYTDLSGETGLAYTKLINFDLDTAGPVLSSAVVQKGTDNLEYLVLTFNEDVVSGASLANITLTGTATKNYITSSTLPVSTLTANKLVVDTTNAKIARIKLADLVGSTDNANTVYDLTLAGETSLLAACAIVDDISANAGATTLKVNFTRGTDGTTSNTAQATIDTTVGTNGIAVVDNNTLTVGFAQELDGATATNVDNYTIDGAVVEKAILNPVASSKQTVTLKLKANSNTFSGVRNIAINGVKANGGLAMDAYTTTEDLYENVAPTVTKAVLTDTDKITVTFSESVVNATAATGDFDLYIGGVKVANTVTTAQQTTGANTIELTLGTPLTLDNINAGLALKATDAIDINDGIGSGNVVSAPSAITVTQ